MAHSNESFQKTTKSREAQAFGVHQENRQRKGKYSKQAYREAQRQQARFESDVSDGFSQSNPGVCADRMGIRVRL